MANVNEMAKNISSLMTNIRYAIVTEILDFCDEINSDIPESERKLHCPHCEYANLCDLINDELDELQTLEFLANRERK